jgi:hypothetical protein
MNPSEPFDEEHDPQLKVTLSGDHVEVRGVEQLTSVEEFKDKLKQLSPEQLLEVLQNLNTPLNGPK